MQLRRNPPHSPPRRQPLAEPRPQGSDKSAKGADARHHKRRSTPQPFRWPLDTAPVLRVFLESAKGADARHHERRSTPQPFRWPLDTAPVLRVFLESAKGADARHHKRRSTPQPFRWPLDTAPVLRVFLESAKGADARHHKRRSTPQPFRWPLDTVPVLRVFRQTTPQATDNGPQIAFLRKGFPLFLTAVALVYGFAKMPWDKPADSWTAADTETILNRSPWSVQTDASVLDPYDAREEQPVAPPQTGLNIPGQNKQPWDGGVGKNRMGHLPTLPAMVRWESALPVRLAEKDNASLLGAENSYVISVSGLVPAGRYRDVGKTETTSQSEGGLADARNPEEILEAFMSYSKIEQKGGPDLKPDNVKLDGATGVVRVFFLRKTAIDPAQKEVLFTTHFGKLNVKVKFQISRMKYQGRIEL